MTTKAQTQEAPESSSGIEHLVPEDTTITTRSGVVVTVKTVKVKHLKRVMSAITPMYFAFKSASVDNLDYLSLVSNHTDEVISLVCTMTDQPQTVIEELDIDELVIVFSEIVRKNVDFFIKNVLPALSGALEHVAVQFRSQIGSISSKG